MYISLSLSIYIYIYTSLLMLTSQHPATFDTSQGLGLFVQIELSGKDKGGPSKGSFLNNRLLSGIIYY